jgi:anti-sigma regulatory factor (Ser/Thr protein kinase)
MFIGHHLIHHGLMAHVDRVGLVTSELTTNVVLHARTPFTVALAYRGETLTLLVRDRAASLPVSHPLHPDLDERGRELPLIAALSSSWGVTPMFNGKTVWATFEVVEDPFTQTTVPEVSR